MDIIDRIRADVDRIQRDKRAERKTLSKLTGMTIHELDADLTAPDPQAQEARIGQKVEA